MDKLDLTRKYKSYYTAKRKPEVLEFGPAQYVSIQGKGDPSGKEFAGNVEALYSTAYTLKFIHKEKRRDFVVAKLEGLWWFDEKKFPGRNISTSVEIPRSEWEYRLLVRMPEFVTKTDVEAAVKSVIEKKGIELASRVEFFEMNEGKCVQVLHVGSFSSEPETLRVLGDFMNEKKFSKNGLHHEIYLSDFRKTEESKLKTILREPVQ